MKIYRVTHWFANEKKEDVLFTKAKNINEAKDAARSFIFLRLMDERRGSVQINSLMNDLRMRVRPS